jgi:replication factor C small subunit
MTELENLIWTEKYRPQNFDDLILANKASLLHQLKQSKMIPSFIFYSSNPGTGKTSTAKIIAKTLDCDLLLLNSSDERGIDVIRDKIKLFACSMSSTEGKRCIFLDEADGLTKPAQDSLRNIIETYCGNCFFIFSCNDISKIIEPIRSRCLNIDFERPDKASILIRLEEICDKEGLKYTTEQLSEMVEYYYPDIRSMIMRLQQCQIDTSAPLIVKENFEDFWKAVKGKNVKYIYDKVYSGEFKIMDFNKWLFRYLYDNYDSFGYEKTAKISLALADTEKHWDLGANLEVIFLSNIMKIMGYL